MDLTGVLEPYTELVFKVRDLGTALSDRRAVKILKLLAASALLCDRMACDPSDLWVLRYVWDREEQMEPLAALVNGVLQMQAEGPQRHSLAGVQTTPDARNWLDRLQPSRRRSMGLP